jgi:hypothetical protein
LGKGNSDRLGVVIVILVATAVAVAVADIVVVFVVVLIVIFLIKIIRCNVLMTLCRATADCSKLPAT